MNDQDLKRLMAQQYLIYKKLTELKDLVEEKHIRYADILLMHDFKKEVDEIMKVMEKRDIIL